MRVVKVVGMLAGQDLSIVRNALQVVGRTDRSNLPICLEDPSLPPTSCIE